MRARRGRHPLAAVLVLALAAAGAVPPATALAPAAVNSASAVSEPAATTSGTRNKLFRVTSRNAGEGGARARGTLKFHAWNEVDVVGRIRDLCPGDGRRGVVRVDLQLRRGDGPGLLGTTTGTCGGDADSFVWPFTTSGAIVRVRVRVCTSRPDGSGLGECHAKNYRNPKVRR